MRRLLLVMLLALIAAGMLAPAAQARTRKIALVPVQFAVQNVNRSQLPCGTDGAPYQIRGHITGPRSILAGTGRSRVAPTATLYLHGLGYGEWFWRFTKTGRSDVPVPSAGIPANFKYATEQAKRGHVSVTIDRLGYDFSGHPDGRRSCLGGQADIAHQVVQALKAGTYTAQGANALRFRRVALAGHSIGAQIAMVEAYSFQDVEALVLASFTFQNLPRAQVALGPTRDACLAGGQPAELTDPTGYAYFGQPAAADFEAIMFHRLVPSLRGYVLALRNRDPCGDIDSIIPALLQQQVQLPKIRDPVLIICGTRDALFSALGCRMQADRFRRRRGISVELVRNIGHALTLEPPAKTFRRKVSRWLDRRGF
jgi:pimeloyl-ACP methyl ester carboxylesterase